jgi:uncharacterized protein YndB with AHSA1/START domain
VKDFATITKRSTLTFERYLPGPVERVWAYLTDPEFLVKWFSDGIVADRVGGEVRFEMGATGRITAFEPPRLLEYTWNELQLSRGPIVNALVRWELSEEGDGVRLTLTHSRLPENEVLAHGAGWHAFLHRLYACVDGREPEPIGDLYPRFKAEYARLVPSADTGTSVT